MSAYGRLSVTESSFANLGAGKIYDVTVDDTGHVEIVAESPVDAPPASTGVPEPTEVSEPTPDTETATDTETNPRSTPKATA